MYQDIMNRPMFQTPQQRQGGGIMAGVAPTTPVRGYADGDLVSDDFFSIEQTEEGSGLNARDISDALILDINDPVDVALTGAMATLIAGGVTAPGALAPLLAKIGYKGKKVYDKIKQYGRIRKMSDEDIMGNVPPPRSTGVFGQTYGPGSSGGIGKLARTGPGGSGAGKGAGKGSDVVEEVVDGGPGRFRRALGSKTALGGGLATLASVLPYELIPEGVKDYAGEIYEDYVPEGLKEYISPDTGERVELTDPAKEKLEKITESDVVTDDGRKKLQAVVAEQDRVRKAQAEADAAAAAEKERLANRGGIEKIVDTVTGAVSGVRDVAADLTADDGPLSRRNRIGLGAGIGEARSGRKIGNFNAAIANDQLDYDAKLQGIEEGTALKQNFNFLARMFPKKEPAELMQLAAGKDPQTTIALTLLDTMSKNNPGDDRKNFTQAMEFAEAYMKGELSGVGQASVAPSASVD